MRRSFLLSLCLMAWSASLALAQDNWPRWRGPLQDGHHPGQNLPLEWDESNVAWRVELPGDGQSSPCIWENRIFLTGSQERGTKRVVFCIDKNSGDLLWERTAWEGQPEPTHKENGYASATCATDGEFVYAFFGKGGLHCFTIDGRRVWSKDLGPFQGPWGVAASPVIVRNMVIQNCDADANARLMAFDRTTGEELWSTPREQTRGWSTPILIQTKAREELVLNGHSNVRAYDPETGSELWRCDSFNGRGSPTATYGDGLVFLVCGLRGDMYAVRPGGTGNVTRTRMQWHTTRPGGRDLPSPIVIGNYVLVMNKSGILCCYQADSGKELYRERVGGAHSASPISYRGRALFQDWNGKTYVVKPGPKLELEAENSLGNRDGEIFRASPVPNAGSVYLRSNTHLYKVVAKN